MRTEVFQYPGSDEIAATELPRLIATIVSQVSSERVRRQADYFKQSPEQYLADCVMNTLDCDKSCADGHVGPDGLVESGWKY
jgi:hypothetical protein